MPIRVFLMKFLSFLSVRIAMVIVPIFILFFILVLILGTANPTAKEAPRTRQAHLPGCSLGGSRAQGHAVSI